MKTQQIEYAAGKPAAATLTLSEQIRALQAEKRALRARIRELVAARRQAGLTLRDVGRIAIAASLSAALANASR